MGETFDLSPNLRKTIRLNPLRTLNPKAFHPLSRLGLRRGAWAPSRCRAGGEVKPLFPTEILEGFYKVSIDQRSILIYRVQFRVLRFGAKQKSKFAYSCVSDPKKYSLFGPRWSSVKGIRPATSLARTNPCPKPHPTPQTTSPKSAAAPVNPADYDLHLSP